ncbi:DNA alkylation repair protein [Dysgonomonas sp. 520]|uniref:DNA alkylation repair protein n=1 Tax=Dysgonomonas sp. 520 TaxID=2302931 RepID=UPI0013D3F4E9|nr:DNA alkylation repair protein [Dysgonomonas sp. 520]NDW08525.1 DNA alkylation repair protein [Dysgonomonas sp. 520]
MGNIIADIRQALKNSVDEKTKSTGQKFFKEEIRFYGVKVTKVHEIAKQAFSRIKDKPKKEIFALCEELWKSGLNEETYIACDWSFYIRKDYKPEDFKVFEKWVDLYVNNWSSCDSFCNHSVGEFIEMYPQHIEDLKRWAKSENRWVKRGAAVTLILPARKGMFLKDIFEISDILLLDSDDMVQKGYGWMLKAASQAHQQEVFEYVMSKKAIMPRTSLRYAIEKMSQDLRTKAMEK